MAGRGRPREFDLDQALDAAINVFWSQGYEGTTLDDLTKAMGISRPSLYAAFGDKEATFKRAVERYSQVDQRYVETALAQSTADEPRVEVDHTYVMALVYEPEFTDGGIQYPSSWRSLGSDSVIPYDGTELGVGEVHGTVQSEPTSPDPDAVDYSLEDEMTGKGVDELVTALNGATPGARGDFGPTWRTND